MHEAINFLKNEGRKLSDNFLKDLVWLKRLRNRIEHHKFEMQIREVEETIGRLISAFVEFDQAHENIELDHLIESGQYDLFLHLADNYQLNLKKAQAEVEAARKKAFDGLNMTEWNSCRFGIFHCYECGHHTMIPNEDSATGCRCTFCGNEESDEIEVSCGICGVPWARGFMTYSDWAGDGHAIHVCPRCSGE